jgi:CheY-like chemotaxis protein
MSKGIFRVVIVDDEFNDIVDVERMLEATGCIDVTHKPSYAAFGQGRDAILAAVEPYDVLVLDVFMQEDNVEPFKQFVEVIKGQKPFLAYTRLRNIEDIELGRGTYEELRSWIIERCGLGLVTKQGAEFRGPDHDARRDREYDVAERVIECYWAWRL